MWIDRACMHLVYLPRVVHGGREGRHYTTVTSQVAPLVKRSGDREGRYVSSLRTVDISTLIPCFFMLQEGTKHWLMIRRY